MNKLSIGLDSGSNGRIGYYILGPEELRKGFLKDMEMGSEDDFDKVTDHLWEKGSVGNTTLKNGWWVTKTPQKTQYTVGKELPTEVCDYVRAAYTLGVNPLPQLRKGLPQVKWEYVSSSQYIVNKIDDGSVSATRFVQPVGHPVVLAAWCDQSNEMALAFWDGGRWYGDFDSFMFPYHLHGPKAT